MKAILKVIQRTAEMKISSQFSHLIEGVWVMV